MIGRDGHVQREHGLAARLIPNRREAARVARLELRDEHGPRLAICRLIGRGEQAIGGFVDLARIGDGQRIAAGCQRLGEGEVDPLQTRIHGKGRHGTRIQNRRANRQICRVQGQRGRGRTDFKFDARLAVKGQFRRIGLDGQGIGQRLYARL